MMPTTFYEVRSRDGVLMAVHKRVDRPDGGKDISWLGPHGAVGLDGTPATALPLFGIDRLDAWPAMSPIVVTEGEKAALALQELGIPTVATVTGAASVPGVEVLRDLEGRAVVLWADHDDAGRKHMQQLADRLEPIAAVGWVVWPDAPAKGDAADFVAGGRTADFVAGGRTADDVRALLRRATTVPMAVAVSAVA